MPATADRKQTIYLALDPSVGCSVQQFVAAWNAGAAQRQAPQARVETPPPSTFDPTGLAEVGFAVITGITSGLFTNAIYDVIKEAVGVVAAPAPARVELHVEHLPNGALHIVARAIQDGSVTDSTTLTWYPQAPD